MSQTPSGHLGEQLFYALFGVDNIPIVAPPLKKKIDKNLTKQAKTKEKERKKRESYINYVCLFACL